MSHTLLNERMQSFTWKLLLYQNQSSIKTSIKILSSLPALGDTTTPGPSCDNRTARTPCTVVVCRLLSVTVYKALNKWRIILILSSSSQWSMLEVLGSVGGCWTETTKQYSFSHGNSDLNFVAHSRSSFLFQSYQILTKIITILPMCMLKHLSLCNKCRNKKHFSDSTSSEQRNNKYNKTCIIFQRYLLIATD